MQNVAAALVGLGAGVGAIVLAQVDPRYTVAATAGIGGGIALLCLGSLRRSLQALVMAIGLTLPLGISTTSVVTTTLMPTTRAADQYVDHMVSVGGIAVSVPMIAAVTILVLSLFARRGRGILAARRIDPLPASGAAFLFVAGLLSLANAEDWVLSAFELTRMLVGYFLFTFLFGNLDRATVGIYLRALGTIIFADGVVATIQYLAGAGLGGILSPTVDRVGSFALVRASGLLAETNAFALIMDANLPLVLALSMVEKARPWRLLFIAATLAGFAGVYASQTRGSWIALPVPLLIVVLSLAGRRIWSLKAAAGLVIVSLALGAVLIAAGPRLVERLGGEDGGSARSRVPMALGALDLVEQFPLFGVGVNNYADALARHDRKGYAHEFVEGNGIVHNMYLWSWAETGAVGLAALLWYFASAFWRALIGWRASGADAQARAIAIGVGAGLAALMVHGFFDLGFRLDNAFATVATLIGLLAGLPSPRAAAVAGSNTSSGSALPDAGTVTS